MEDSQLLRYSRQILLPRIDLEGQERLLNATVLIIGLGGLGSPAAMYLAAAGVGRLMVNDFDRVDLSNLQRQILHGTPDIGMAKTASAVRSLRDLNPDIRIDAIEGRLDDAVLESIVADADVVLDCSDNLGTRFAVNRACFRQAKRLVSGAVIRFEGQLGVFWPGVGDSPCYNCLYQTSMEAEETCSRTGVIAPLPGIIGSMQALEAIKLLSVKGYAPDKSLLLFDAWSLDWQRIRLAKNSNCPTCGVAA